MSKTKISPNIAVQSELDAIEYCIFTVHGQEYGIDRSKVRKVCAEQDIAWLPGACGLIRGAIKLHGIDVPVLDLRRLFNIDGSGFDALGDVVVLEIADMTVGVLVDDVLETTLVPPLQAIPVMRVLQH